MTIPCMRETDYTAFWKGAGLMNMRINPVVARVERNCTKLNILPVTRVRSEDV